jgi:hypothetical protein
VLDGGSKESTQIESLDISASVGTEFVLDGVSVGNLIINENDEQTVRGYGSFVAIGQPSGFVTGANMAFNDCELDMDWSTVCQINFDGCVINITIGDIAGTMNNCNVSLGNDVVISGTIKNSTIATEAMIVDISGTVEYCNVSAASDILEISGTIKNSTLMANGMVTTKSTAILENCILSDFPSDADGTFRFCTFNGNTNFLSHSSTLIVANCYIDDDFELNNGAIVNSTVNGVCTNVGGRAKAITDKNPDWAFNASI